MERFSESDKGKRWTLKKRYKSKKTGTWVKRKDYQQSLKYQREGGPKTITCGPSQPSPASLSSTLQQHSTAKLREQAAAPASTMWGVGGDLTVDSLVRPTLPESRVV